MKRIRTWLNSDEEAVTYEDQAPTDKAMTEMKDGYSNEPGFLHDFSEEEKELFVTVKNKTATNVLAKNDEITTKDKVYLLSVDELKWFEDADISIFAEPTKETIENNPGWFTIYEELGVSDYLWWTRSPDETQGSKAYMVASSYSYDEESLLSMNVGCEGYGIRPAVTIKIR